jgi:hypothetical protein
MEVAGVVLPPGAKGRPVDAPTLELDLADAAPDSSPLAPRAATDALWVSNSPLQEPAGTWKRLASGFAQTGLWPLLLLPAEPTDRDEWIHHRARRERDILDARPTELFSNRLVESLQADTPLASIEALRASRVATGTLVTGSGRRGDAVDATIATVGPARLALVGVRRPADAVHCLAWPATAIAEITGVEFSEMLASWEERWGAILIALDAHALTFAVLRPPTSEAEAIEAAAEHHALYPDELAGVADDRAYAQSLVDRVTWTLTWS